MILLIFSFKGCGQCEAMYPTMRPLIDQYEGRPLVVISVMADPDRQTTLPAIESGKITWQC